MNCPDCDWTADHVHYPRPPAPDSTTSVEQATARRQENPLLAAGTAHPEEAS